LTQYVENIKNNILNDKMIILYGKERTGKTTLSNDIRSYLGAEMCETCMLSGDIIYSENINKKLLFLADGGPYRSKKNNTAIMNLIKYKQSFLACTTNIEKVNNKLLEFSKIITMEHIFPNPNLN
jgi:adenylylsulfate kinase-like enzyme